MRKINFLGLILLFVVFFACQKNNTTNPSNTTNPNSTTNTNDYFISFDLDTVSVEIRAANSGLGITGGVGSGVTSNVTDPNDPNRSLSIAFEHDKDSLVEADFLAMVGQKIEVGDCYSSPCAMKSDFYYKLSSSLSIGSDASNNPLPNYYIKVTAAAYHSTVQQFPSPIKRYLVEGEFELLLKQFPNDPIQAATNGKFRLLFSDNTY